MVPNGDALEPTGGLMPPKPLFAAVGLVKPLTPAECIIIEPLPIDPDAARPERPPPIAAPLVCVDGVEAVLNVEAFQGLGRANED
jgi:hypothetical protein